MKAFPSDIDAARAALAANPAQADALKLLGSYALMESDPQKAAELYFALGIARQRTGQLREAVASYGNAVKHLPSHAQAWANRGIALRQLGQANEAQLCFRKAIEADPDMAGFYFNLGNILRDSGDVTGAVEQYRLALDRLETGGVKDRPLYISVANNMGMAVMTGLADFANAAIFFRTALHFEPNNPDMLANLGVCLSHQGKFDEGIAYYRRALALQPENRAGLNNLGSALRATGQLDEALAVYRKLVPLYPDFAEGRANFAMALLNAGQLEQGWAEHVWRHLMPSHPPRHQFAKPVWRGEAIAGQRLLVHAEQGHGDTIQFCRYVSMAAAQGIKVMVEVQPALVRLLRSIKTAAQVIAMGEPLPDFDWHCPMMDLPLAFHTKLETVPAQIPYLAADRELLAKWRKRAPSKAGVKKVGLAWAGNPRKGVYDHMALDRRRSVPVERLEPLLDVGGLQFYSLQKEAAPPPADFDLIDLMDQCEDFADTAALISQLDLVITVDTSIVHLAGALGKPVWMLDRIDSCWRWLPGREDSPWYPSLRIFRQEKSGEWPPVIERVAEKLALWAKGKTV